jgi:hypothetical protein
MEDCSHVRIDFNIGQLKNLWDPENMDPENQIASMYTHVIPSEKTDETWTVVGIDVSSTIKVPRLVTTIKGAKKKPNQLVTLRFKAQEGTIEYYSPEGFSGQACVELTERMDLAHILELYARASESDDAEERVLLLKEAEEETILSKEYYERARKATYNYFLEKFQVITIAIS